MNCTMSCGGSPYSWRKSAPGLKPQLLNFLNFIALSLLEYDANEHRADGYGACVVCELSTLHIGLDRVYRRCFQAKF